MMKPTQPIRPTQQIKLTPEEKQEKSDGQFLHEMTQTPGFKVLREHLETLAFHSWVDPRTIEGPDAEKEWKFRELNAFYAADNAKGMIEWIGQKIGRAEGLEKKRRGELLVRPLTIK